MSDKTGILFKAATVLLLREEQDGFEVFMVKRPAESAGFANALVFPGGRLDAADECIDIMADFCRFPDGISDDDLAHRICGIRETFEEACILLARPSGSEDLIGGERMVAMVEKYRKPLHSGEIGLAEIAKAEPFRYPIFPGTRAGRSGRGALRCRIGPIDMDLAIADHPGSGRRPLDRRVRDTREFAEAGRGENDSRGVRARAQIAGRADQPSG
jgi:8-oxo-dGTP pyrophosphatase MutT (NUDIX family)